MLKLKNIFELNFRVANLSFLCIAWVSFPCVSGLIDVRTSKNSPEMRSLLTVGSVLADKFECWRCCEVHCEESH